MENQKAKRVRGEQAVYYRNDEKGYTGAIELDGYDKPALPKGATEITKAEYDKENAGE